MATVGLIALTGMMYGADRSPEALIERAGRICYRSHRTDATPERFICSRIREGHESLLEHASATFEISGLSRACSHQLVRHRIASYSQESQRYVNMCDPKFVMPQAIRDNPEACRIFCREVNACAEGYEEMLELGIRKEDARYILPNATQTKLLVTMNFRAFRHLFELRCAETAQWEIRAIAREMLCILHVVAYSTFDDLYVRFIEEDEND